MIWARIHVPKIFPPCVDGQLSNPPPQNFFYLPTTEVFFLLTLSLFTIVLLAEIFTPYLVYLIAPGFFDDLEKFNLAVEFTRITFPFLLFVSLSSFFSGILNSNNKFAAAAAAPIILNIVLISSLLISYKFELSFAKNLSYGVFFSGIIQLLFLIFFTKKYYKPSFLFKKKISSKVKFFLKKLLPSIFSSGVTQINILVGTIIASFETSAVSYLYYADRVYQINLAIAGIAVGTVSLPILSKAIKTKNILKVSNIQNKSIELSLMLSIPASLGLILASEQIINALFGYGSFSEKNIEMTAEALKYFGYGIPAFALIKILSNFFFARDDTKTPFYISVFVVLSNIFISLTFFKEIGFVIIAIATSVSTWFGVIIYVLFRLKDIRRIFFLIILGGSLGNLFDRLFYNAVPDFIDFHVGNLHWFIFNPADIFISIGAFCLILDEFFFKNKKND